MTTEPLPGQSSSDEVPTEMHGYSFPASESGHEDGPGYTGEPDNSLGSAPPPGPPRGPQAPGQPGTGGQDYPADQPMQPYRGGAGGSDDSGGGGESGSGPFGSGRIVLIILAAVVLVGIVIAAVVLLLRPEGSTTTLGPGSSASAAPPSSSPEPSVVPSDSPEPSASPSSTSPDAALPAAAAIPDNVAVVPMRPEDERDRGLYLVDVDGKIEQVQLDAASGNSSNPMMQKSRDTIVYINAGELRVMASDGSGERRLFDRDPAGCERVEHASWSQADPNVMVISCRVSKQRDTMLVIGMDGRLIRRLDPGKDHIGDVSVSPDGQTVLFWATDSDVDGGALYTLPLIGTGSPKKLTSGAEINADPAWSPDSSQIAFRRLVQDGSENGNADVFLINADGSGERAVIESEAEDFKPSWSPDGDNLLVISNRKSAYGGPGKTYDLWLVRIGDGEVLTPLGLDAEVITRPFWTMR